MILKDKVAVIYGAGGAIGGAVARAFAGEGAQLFLTGHRRASVEAVANDIVASGGLAEAAEVDALDEQAINRHLQSVVDRSGRIDVSFNAIGSPVAKTLGVSLLEMDVEQFALPIAMYTRSYFLTARLAARRMIPNQSGVILTVSSIPARIGTLLNGGYGPAHAAKDALTRDLSTEFAPKGIRVLGLRPHGIPETGTMRKLLDVKVAKMGLTWEQFENYIVNWSHPRRALTLKEVGSMAVLLASDQASGMTGTTVNLTMGGIND